MGVIYKTTNKINGKIYIGKRVFNSDKFNRSKYYGSGKLIKLSIVKYGMDNFNREILEEVENNLLSKREIYWIDYFNSTNLDIGYNLSSGGNSTCGRIIGKMSDITKQKLREITLTQLKVKGHPFKNKHHTDETKNKIRKKLEGVILSENRIKKSADGHRGLKYNKPPKVKKEKIDQSIKIVQKYINGEYIKTWHSIMEASKYYGFDRSGISRACSGKYKQCNGYKWEYLETI